MKPISIALVAITVAAGSLAPLTGSADTGPVTQSHASARDARRASLPLDVDAPQGFSRDPSVFSAWARQRVDEAQVQLDTLARTNMLDRAAYDEFASRRSALESQLARAGQDGVVSANERLQLYRQIRDIEELSDRFELPLDPSRGGGPPPVCVTPSAQAPDAE